MGVSMKQIRILAPLLCFLLPVMLQAAASPCHNGHSGSKYHCKQVTLQSRVGLNRFPGKPRSASSIWGYSDPDDNREYAIIGLRNGTGVVDVTNPIRPKIIGHIPGVESLWREVKVYSVLNKSTKKWDAYAYISTEGLNGGLQVIDLSDLPNSVSLAATDTDISTSHTLFISNLDYATGKKLKGKKTRLYVNGSDRAGLVIFSLSNPKNPRVIGEYNDTYVHDSYGETFSDSRTSQCAPGHTPCQILFAWTGGDFRVLDVTNPRSIGVLGTLVYPDLGYAHSGWISNDKQYLFNFDEVDEIDSDSKTKIYTIDIANFQNPTISGAFRGPEKSIEHNGIVIGNKLFLAHYTRGLVIMDVTNPKKIRELAFFDSHPEDDDENREAQTASHPGHEGQIGFHGAWGVYPFLPSGNILISDLERGLFVLKEQ
jgi:choice-of-anchor B domain-containing protein